MQVGDGPAERVGVAGPVVAGAVGLGADGGAVGEAAGLVAGGVVGAVVGPVLADGLAEEAGADGLLLRWGSADGTGETGTVVACADASPETASPTDAECPGSVGPAGATPPSGPPMTAIAIAPIPPTTRPATDSTTTPRCRPRALRPRDGAVAARLPCGRGSSARGGTGSGPGCSDVDPARPGGSWAGCPYGCCPACAGVAVGAGARNGTVGPDGVPDVLEVPHPGQHSAPLRCRRQAVQ
ncbi:hypothetical protein Kpho02_33540 [Kitasatospora phosalacinea]|uniref:Uncharacterized protein n=1 Tax=Kitasatospora phosalacinea TaxID=2065 RepID=A0A9W6Q6C1_9ACTN|nr:hypothetical protein Kpho02_33540 [Kitasatospora phosalacinea]